MSATQAPSTTDKVVIIAEFANCTSEALFDCWVKPDLITQWWPPVAEIEPALGGTYHLSWPKMNWHLRGRYTVFEPGKQLGFTWKWDHYLPQTEVMVLFEPLSDDSTKLTVTHGSYSNSQEDQDARMGHLEGWQNFVNKLLDTSITK